MITEILHKQTKHSYHWLNKIIEDIPENKWELTPEKIETNIVWQIGHLIVSINYHSIIVINGQPIEIYKDFPFQKYAELFTKAKAKDAIGKVSVSELKKFSELFQKKSLDTLNYLSDDELNNPLEPFVIKHPIAKTKQEAIEWNIQHTMWHCGQIGLLKRYLSNKQDYGLKI